MAVLCLDVRAEVHASAVPPAVERCAGIFLARDEVLGGRHGFVIDGFHALPRERPGVFDGLAALAVSLALEHSARAELLLEGLAVGEHEVLWIIKVLRLFL